MSLPDLPVSSQTDVLVVGVGPAGGTAAMCLAKLGVDVLFITKYRWTANTPRAHITNQRAMEVFRDHGIEDRVALDATPHHLMGDTVFCTALAGEELGRIHTWGTGPDRQGDYESASPTMNCDIPQTYLEPIILRRAVELGARALFSTEYLGHEQDEDGVTTHLRDRVTGHEYLVRSKYLIGADGARSEIAKEIGLSFEGRMDVAGSMNIIFKADLSQLVESRHSVLYWVLRPGANIGGIGMGLLRMVRPWNEWLIVWGYDISQPAPELTEADAIRIARDLIGIPDLPIEIVSYNLWGNNDMYATTLSNGRVFCMGDAIHRHPPSNGLGSNTSVQDAYNLAWKIAYVLKGWAGPGLLDSYTPERAPVAKRIVTRANKSSGEFAPAFEALGVLDTSDPVQMQRNIDSRKDASEEGAARRAALRVAMELKNYEFNALGVELGQFYESGAIVPDGTEPPAPRRDPDLYYEPSTVPGSHLPHAWLLDASGRKVSTLDAAGSGVFSVFTGINGAAMWRPAAEAASAELGVPILVNVVGPGQELEDPYFDWARLSDIEEDGVLLVRPDKHVAFRCRQGVPDATATLREALRAILARA